MGGCLFIAAVFVEPLQGVTFPVSAVLFGIAAAGAYEWYAPTARTRRLGAA